MFHQRKLLMRFFNDGFLCLIPQDLQLLIEDQAFRFMHKRGSLIDLLTCVRDSDRCIMVHAKQRETSLVARLDSLHIATCMQLSDSSMNGKTITKLFDTEEIDWKYNRPAKRELFYINQFEIMHR